MMCVQLAVRESGQHEISQSLWYQDKDLKQGPFAYETVYLFHYEYP